MYFATILSICLGGALLISGVVHLYQALRIMELESELELYTYGMAPVHLVVGDPVEEDVYEYED